MFLPVADLDVSVAMDGIANSALFPVKFGQPALDKPWSIVVIGVEKAREHSRGRASPPRIVAECEELEEKKPSVPTHPTDGF